MSKFDVNKLSVDELIGQLIVFGFDALEINEHAIEMIKKHKAGNVILFARNVESPSQLYKLNQNLQKLALAELGIPLLITIDQEGGMVTRIKNGSTYFPGAMTVSASNSVEHSLEVGQLMGKELLDLGINMNLAPSLDVNNNPYNPVIGVRSYSDNPSRVAEYGSAFIQGLQESVIATAKHFPGHGDTKVDSHLALPTIDYDKERLNSVELYPFKEAIKNGVKAIMSSHINFPAYTEEGRPSTLSKSCLTGLLREELGFEGLIITDCMQMKAIQHTYGTKVGTYMAIDAGANLVCISHSIDLQTESINYLKEMIETSQLSIDLVKERVDRILKYKEDLDVNLSKSFDSVMDLVINDKTKNKALEITRKAVTQVKGKPFLLEGKTLLIASEPISTTIADENDGSYSIIKAVKKEMAIDTFRVSVRLTDSEIEDIIRIKDQYDKIVFCSYNANIYKKQIELIDKLNSDKLTVCMMRNPYDLVFANNIENLVAFYEYTPNSVLALVSYLKGELTPIGVIPVAYE